MFQAEEKRILTQFRGVLNLIVDVHTALVMLKRLKFSLKAVVPSESLV